MDKYILPDFFIIPTEVALDEDLQPLDGYVYAIVYWYTKLKLERCTASNQTIAGILSKKFKTKKSVNPTSIANSLTRLTRKKFVKVVMDVLNHRVEIVPLISFNSSEVSTPSSNDERVKNLQQQANPTPPSSNDDTPIIISLTPPSSNDEQNKNIYASNIEKDKVNKLTRAKAHSRNTDVDEILKHLRQVMQIPKLDLSEKTNRQYAWNLLQKSKTGKAGVFWLIDLAGQDPWFQHHICSMRDLWNNQVKIVSSVRGQQRKVAVYVES